MNALQPSTPSTSSQKVLISFFGIILASFAADNKTAANSKVIDPTAMVTAHNQWRSKVKVPDLSWSSKLATSAQQWADQLGQTGCNMKHSTGSYGENIYYAGPLQQGDGISSPQQVVEQDVVDSWGNEVKNYDYESNSCHSVCGHYTQVVWKSTTEVGCGMVVCADNEQIWVCQYNPRGNMMGERPY
jgi:pathogenesis-related protein 1